MNTIIAICIVIGSIWLAIKVFVADDRNECNLFVSIGIVLIGLLIGGGLTH